MMELPTLNFTEMLKELMTDQNLSARGLAKLIGIGDTDIGTWLSGEYMPSTVNVIKLADFFHCSVDYLLGLSDKKDSGPRTVKADFLTRLKLLMENSGLSKNKLAKECGFYGATVTKWEQGKMPGPETLVKLATVFGCSIDYLLGRSDYM